MNEHTPSVNRRNFIKKTSLLTLGALGATGVMAAPHLQPLPKFSQDSDVNIFGPKEGYTPQIGTLVSMMNWMRMVILSPVKDMSVSDLDYLVDDDANSIGAMLMHLAATERFYQIHTFENKSWGDWSKEDSKKWSVASGLGEKARNEIKGRPFDYYLEEMTQVRDFTLAEFKNRDDDWLMSIDANFPWGPTNNYCKWFHVCEHESNHNGQFKFIKSRIA
ncbi:DinB family protein [Croceitalea rosinachiae]|uniref:DinB family protein n=1 Tax=Croceitalea rosinachiae TaxID=3075596 RepID=A0ABU3AAF0_9FLAO|nr:DinB family protein [Croceitalea sp. F388]MDT0607164.1 DinB family protein [Croceitalea sp. F388]